MGRPELFASPPGTPLASGVLLPLARYRFTFRMADELRLPEFAGSLLRGQFGSALRRTACMTGAKRCEPCPLWRTCPYPAIFETPPPLSHALQRFSQVPNPYVIEPPPFGTRGAAAGDTLDFSLVLVGRALDQLPLIAFAFQRAFRAGVGKARAKGEVEAIVWQTDDSEVPVWDAAASRILRHEPSLAMPPLPACGEVTLRFETPLRLQNQGHPLGIDALRPRTLLTALMRRGSLLFEMHAGKPGLASDAAALARHAEALAHEHQLRWRDWTRYSSRQRAQMTLGGVIGEWTLRGNLEPLLPWLWLGQWLHVGKNATMGLGRYTLV